MSLLVILFSFPSINYLQASAFSIKPYYQHTSGISVLSEAIPQLLL
jgi:hypothetical protein